MKLLATTPRKKIVFIFIFCLLLTGLIFSKPAYRQVKSWRSNWLAQQAEKLLKDERTLEALHKAGAAYQLDPYNPRILLLMARLYAAVNPDYALSFWANLKKINSLTEETQKEYIRYCLLLRRSDLVDSELKELLERSPTNASTLLIAAEIAALKGNGALVEIYCQKILNTQPQNRAAQLLLATYYLSIADSRKNVQGLEYLESLSRGTDELSLQALYRMSQLSALSPAQVESIRLKIKTHPLAQEKDQLYAESLSLKLYPLAKSKTFDNIQKSQAQKQPKERLNTARWFNQQRESSRVTQILTLPEALSRQDLFLVWADAMALQKRWTELDQVFSKEAVPMEALMVTLFRARISRELGELKQSEILWNRALSDARTRPEVLWYMASYAEKLKANDLAKLTYLKLTELSSFEKNAYLALIKMHFADGDTRELRDTLKLFTDRFPKELFAINDLSYTNLLLGENIPESNAKAALLLEQDPARMAYRVTLALGALRLYQADLAYSYFMETKIEEITLLQPSWQAIYAAIMGARGETERARSVAKTLSNKKLLPEEKALILPYL